MSLAAQTAAVILITNRADLTGEIDYAVKAATLKAHFADFFVRDLRISSAIAIPANTYAGDITLASLTNAAGESFRALNSVTNYAPNANPPTATSFYPVSYEIIGVNDILDSYYQSRTDVMWVAGDNITYRFGRNPPTNVYIRFYCIPNISTGGYASWIDAMFPDVITVEAARQIFKMIGRDEEASMYDKLVNESMQQLKSMAILGVGY